MTLGPRRYRTAAASGGRRRGPRVRRASAGLSPTRAAAVLAMLVSAGAIYGLAATPAFGYAHLEIEGTLLTPSADIESTLALDKGVNLVALSTAPLEERLRAIPTVESAHVSVGLPDTVRIDVTERRPIVVWAAGGRQFAVDPTGMLFATVGASSPPPIASLPVVTDDRSASAGLTIGSILDPVDLDAATRLGSLTPSQIGSTATSLTVRVSDEKGFTVSSGPKGWVAVFGFYGASQRTPALITGQVQLLTALLAGREPEVATVILGDDRDGTFIAKPTPHASASTQP